MRFVALDPSLTATGVADSAAPRDPYTIRPPSGVRGPARLYYIQKRVMEAVEGADLVVLEGYAYGRENQAHQMGELGGVLRLTFYCMRLEWVVVPPAVRAKMATGKGNASKDEVFSQAFVRLGYRGASKDEADALWLLECALQHYEMPGRATLPASHLEPLAKARAKWPPLRELKERREARVA